MLKNLYYKFQLNYAHNANRFIYSIIHFGPLEGQISQEWYVRSDIKKVFGILSLLGAALMDIFWKAFYFFGVVFLPFLWFRSTVSPDSDGTVLAGNVVWAFFILNCMMGSFTNSHIVTDGNEKDYLLLNLMQIDPREHYLSSILWEYGKQTVYYSLMLLICLCGVLHLSLKPVLWVILCYICFRPIGEAVCLRLCERFGIPFREKNKKAASLYHLYNIVMVLIAYGTYPVLYFLQGKNHSLRHPVFDSGVPGNIFMVFVLLAALTGAFFSVRYLDKYPNYLLIARRMCNIGRIEKAKETADAINNASIEVEDLEETEISNHRLFQDKSGYDYLHALFFYRHKKQVKNNARIKAFFLGLVLGVAAIALIMANILMSPAEFMKMSKEWWENINHLLSILVFVMYCVSSGKDLTKAMFYHCDVSLLKYGYYRSQQAILESFRIRLKYMLYTELPVVAVLSGGILADCLLLRQYAHMVQIAALLCCVCILSVFFSVIFLCMYYIFQPFTEGGQETGFGYKFCSAALWVFAYTCLQVGAPPIYFAGMLLALTLLVILASVLLVRWLAPKTFRLK